VANSGSCLGLIDIIPMVTSPLGFALRGLVREPTGSDPDVSPGKSPGGGGGERGEGRGEGGEGEKGEKGKRSD
jgi:hypothetical protein